MENHNGLRLFLSSLIRTSLPIAVPMIILSLLIFHTVNTGVKGEVDEANTARLRQYAAFIDNEFSSLEHLESILSANPTIRFSRRRFSDGFFLYRREKFPGFPIDPGVVRYIDAPSQADILR